jgi:hypothetical protein
MDAIGRAEHRGAHVTFGCWEAAVLIVGIAGVCKLAEAAYQAGRFVGDVFRGTR